jgi:hypothetical protein
MYDRTRLSRLITAALASCAVTWALAGAAVASPEVPPQPVTTAAPAFQAPVGDTNKAPSASTAPAYQPAIGDSLKTPDPRAVQRVLDGLGRGAAPATHTTVVANNDDTGTIALIVAIVAMITALGAVTLVALRQTRPALRP